MDQSYDALAKNIVVGRIDTGPWIAVVGARFPPTVPLLFQDGAGDAARGDDLGTSPANPPPKMITRETFRGRGNFSAALSCTEDSSPR